MDIPLIISPLLIGLIANKISLLKTFCPLKSIDFTYFLKLNTAHKVK